MKKIKLLLIAAAILMLASCQGPVNSTDNGTGNNEETKTFDINKVSFSSEENVENAFKIINTISIGNTHYFILYSRNNFNIKYDNEIIKGNYTSINRYEIIDEYMQSYINGTLDFSDLNTFKNYFDSWEYEILGNDLIVYYVPTIKYSEIIPYLCEQDDDYFLTLANGDKKVHFDLDLSDNRKYRYEYIEVTDGDSTKDVFKKLYKKSNVEKIYNATIDSSRGISYRLPFGDYTNLSDVTYPYDTDNEEAFLNNCFTVIGTDATPNNYYKTKYSKILYRYNFYYKGSFYNGLKPIYKSEITDEGNNYKWLYFDFELDSLYLYDKYEDTFETEVLDYFIVKEDGEQTSKDKIKIELEPNFGLSPFENKVVTLFDMGFIN